MLILRHVSNKKKKSQTFLLRPEMICDHSINSDPIPSNVIFVAACNPFRKKGTSSKISELDCALSAPTTNAETSHQFENLVYAVLPLPLALSNYAWDFGSLSEKDEMSYIEAMVHSQIPDEHTADIFSSCVSKSQLFIRTKCKESTFVTLRDVKRSLQLYHWFEKVSSNRQNYHVFAISIILTTLSAVI
jgi:hypothetical protein